MNTIETGGTPLRGYRRRKMVLDLNSPPCDIREQGGTSQQPHLEEETSHPIEPVPPDAIDVEAIEDDVIESSATAFAEAKNNLRSSRRTVVDVDSGQLAWSTTNYRNKRRRFLPSQTVINCDHYINLESTPQSIVKEIVKLQPPPREPSFSCPICMNSFTEEMSTRCGHIFCKACIKAALAVQGRCPTCRKKVTMKELIRVFLPSSS
ncbi:cell division control protein 45-like protein [Hibiscus syriacus]|uniref:Cell division control protein 45-like protein n=1 Tax=Hibiscus syriacus TaxID=106335 RepID=A0A6A2Z1Q1_HIBSY|nr:E3 ubiquitin-protein ligase RNF4-like [Hibiscus syriacus]XP_039020495.1 E3 ubiquitin-protein ligase RNF4-like [Hibiscus syriacus]KAE8685844.1 cell division control protein 45-like protein [Hibiscus syriacus]